MIQKRTTSSGETRYLVRLYRGRDVLTSKKLYTFETFRTKKEAERWEREHKVKLDTGTFVEPSQERLGDYLLAWLEGTARMTVREQTLAGYRRLLTRYVLPHRIASVPLAKVTTAVLEALYAELTARSLSPRSVRMVHGVLRAALGKAAKDRTLASNPAPSATLPRQDRQEMNALTAAELSHLLATSEAINNRWHALWHVLGHGGLRPGEALGLMWKDVVEDRVHVRRTLVTELRQLMEPKTPRSRRVVELPAETMRALREHKVRQNKERLQAGERYTDNGLVFATQLGRALDLKNAAARHFKPLLRAAGLPPIRVYDLRHTHATLQLSAGIPVHQVSARLGHANAVMTLNVYAHVLNGQSSDAMTKYEAYLLRACEGM
jgi:integrase